MFIQWLDKLKERLGRRWPDLLSKSGSLIRFRSRATVYQGTARWSGAPLSLLYVGNGTNRSFLLDALFGEIGPAREMGLLNIWRAAAFVERNHETADLAIIDLPWPYEVNYTDDSRVIELPSWIRQKFELSSSWEETLLRLRKSARTEEMRKIRKYGLTFATTRNPDAINDFYDLMYLPHTQRRFGTVAPIAPRPYVQYCATQGVLLQILRDGEVIAGSVLCEYAGKLRSLWGGFAGDDWHELEGATGAIYYYTLLFAFHSGYSEIDYCGSRPLLNDGVFNTKRRWGAAVFDDWALESLLLRINRMSAGVESFLSHNGVIARHGDGLVGKILCNDEPVTAQFVDKAVRRSVNPGLDAINIYARHGANDEALAAAAQSDLTIRIIDVSGSADPVVTYCCE